MRTLYNSFIYPYFTYCIEVWGNICTTHLDPLVRIQKRAVRTIVGARKFDHSTPIFKKLKLLNLNEIYIYCVQLFMYKYHHRILPPVFHDLFVSNNTVHSHFTRQQSHFHVPLALTTIMSKTIRITGVTLYNHFESLLSMDMTYDSYKYNLRTFIRDHDISNILLHNI